MTATIGTSTYKRLYFQLKMSIGFVAVLSCCATMLLAQLIMLRVRPSVVCELTRGLGVPSKSPSTT